MSCYLLSVAVGGEGGIRTPDTLASMPHFECGAFNHSATSPEPKTGLKRLRMDGRYVTKRAKTDKGCPAYIAPRSTRHGCRNDAKCAEIGSTEGVARRLHDARPARHFDSRALWPRLGDRIGAWFRHLSYPGGDRCHALGDRFRDRRSNRWRTCIRLLLLRAA